jgi:GNAT superfamily N-acetyltransferase
VTIEIQAVSGYAELERWVEARNEVLPDDPDSAQMMALVRASELEHVDLIACDDGEVVGTGMLAGDPSSLQSSHPYVEVTVREGHRGRGVGSALLQDLSDRARRLGKDGLECESRAHDDYSIAFLERRGFAATGRAAKYELELDAFDGAEPSPPPGIELAMVSDRPDLLQGMYRVAEVTFPEHRIAAVLPEWRRKGVATTLLRAQLAAAKRASIDTVIAWGRSRHLGVVYGARLGFEPRTETIASRGPLQ